jgi:hypothetical protein
VVFGGVVHGRVSLVSETTNVQGTSAIDDGVGRGICRYGETVPSHSLFARCSILQALYILPAFLFDLIEAVWPPIRYWF